MIDEKKLIEDITDVEVAWYLDGNYTTYDSTTIMEIIEKQPKVGEWIPVSEGLPKDNELSEYYDAVIVTLDDERVVNGCYRNRDEEWWVDAEDGEKYSINATGHVVAWMPLPEAYKG